MIVVPASKNICDEFVSRKHYSRKASIYWAGFALVENGMIEGVCVFGQPNPPVNRHAFRDRKFRLYELSRLVVQTPTRNAASVLVGRALKMLQPKPCAVVSYADTEHGHSGIVYQATNWLYTGSTISHDKSYIVDGVRTHSMTLRDMGVTDPSRWAKECGIETIAPSVKHRYFFLVGGRTQKQHMLERLSYKVIDEYPKSEKQTYDAGPRIEIPYVEQTCLI